MRTSAGLTAVRVVLLGCVVATTGGRTAKGQLVRMVLFPSSVTEVGWL